MKSRILSIGGAALVALASSWGAPARAETARPFYAGKSITLVVGSAAGGIFDLGGRIMAQFLEKYIPGHPSIILRNMPGASSIVAAEYMYNVAPADGLTIATLQPLIVLDKNLDPTLKYRPENFSWIGRLEPIVFAGIGWRASGVNTISDARARTVIVSAQGASGISAIMPWALNRLAGTHFHVITGYESQRPAFVAMERGEVQAIGSAALTDVLAESDWSARHRVSVLYTITQKRSSLSPDAPSIVELAKSDDGRKVLTVLGRGMDVGENLLAPPGIPADRLAILRQAFQAMLKDSEFRAAATKLGIIVDPLSGGNLAALVAAASDAPPKILTELRAAAKPQ